MSQKKCPLRIEAKCLHNLLRYMHVSCQFCKLWDISFQNQFKKIFFYFWKWSKKLFQKNIFWYFLQIFQKMAKNPLSIWKIKILRELYFLQLLKIHIMRLLKNVKKSIFQHFMAFLKICQFSNAKPPSYYCNIRFEAKFQYNLLRYLHFSCQFCNL